MGERKGTNKYYPPDFDPQAHKSLNGYHGVHALRERARKIKEGILVIRFEAPWNFFCLGCNSHVGRGVRWNAEKKKVGMYYTTPIYAFHMTCHLCGNKFVFETDPKNCDYRIVEGAKRRTETWDPKDTETIVVPSQEEMLKRMTDPMYDMEHRASDKERAAREKPFLAKLIQHNEATLADNYSTNSVLRNAFRKERNKRKEQDKADAALLAKSSLTMTLVPETKEDIALAKATTFKSEQRASPHTRLHRAEQRVKRESIFHNSQSSSNSKASKNNTAPRGTSTSINTTTKTSVSSSAIRSILHGDGSKAQKAQRALAQLRKYGRIGGTTPSSRSNSTSTSSSNVSSSISSRSSRRSSGAPNKHSFSMASPSKSKAALLASVKASVVIKKPPTHP